MSIAINQACETIGRLAQYASDEADAYSNLAELERWSEQFKRDNAPALIRYVDRVLWIVSLGGGCGYEPPAVEAAKAKSAEFRRQFVMFDEMHDRCLSSIETTDIEEQQAFISFLELFTDPISLMMSIFGA